MDESRVLQHLLEDHRVSAQLLRVAERCLPAALDGDEESLAVLRAVLAREAEYGDRVHHAREELLFSRLASRGETGAQAVRGLAHEHDQLARMGGTARDWVDEVIARRKVDTGQVRAQVTGYIDALRNHMRKEEQRAFPLAPRLLRAADWEQIGGAFAAEADPLAPPAAEPYRALEAWLARNGEVVFEAPGAPR